jgi:nicotinamidase-related amidase
MEQGMAQLVFWDVDTLYDFMRPNGRLYVPGSEEIIPALEALTAFAHAHRSPIGASADNHDSADAEISEAPDWKTTFPPHCMRGTAGQRKIAETALVDPLVLEPEPEDAEALGRRIGRTTATSSSTSTPSMSSPTPMCRHCSPPSPRRRS